MGLALEKVRKLHRSSPEKQDIRRPGTGPGGNQNFKIRGRKGKCNSEILVDFSP